MEEEIIKIQEEEILTEENEVYKKNVYQMIKNKENLKSKNILFEIIKSLSYGIDIFNIQLPVFMIKPMSLLEHLADAFSPKLEILNLSKINDSLDRIIVLTEYIINSVAINVAKSFNMIKPYNPILNEYFKCKWEFEDSTTYFYAEQISHHPPITCVYLENEKSNLKFESTLSLSGNFYGNYANTYLDGLLKLTLTNINEHYDIKVPVMLINGLIWGKTKIELSKNLIIECKETNLRVDVDFFENEKIKGGIKRNNKKIVKIDGKLNEKIYFYNENKEVIKEMEIVECIVEKTTEPLEKQGCLESRRVWHKVTKEIMNDNLEKANVNKKEIENLMRSLKKNGVLNQNNHFFEKIDSNYFFKKI
jgi:oxysterol-binding protein-related protein 8